MTLVKLRRHVMRPRGRCKVDKAPATPTRAKRSSEPAFMISGDLHDRDMVLSGIELERNDREDP